MNWYKRKHLNLLVDIKFELKSIDDHMMDLLAIARAEEKK